MTNTGWRKPTPGLVVAEKHAQAGEQLSIPKSKAIVAVKKVAAAIGLKSQDLLLLDTFGAVTQKQDWEQGRRPIVWASNNFLMEQTGFSLATLRRHVRHLCEAGIIWMKDSPNGKRWGKRDEDGVIVEAYGFDLSPMSARAHEFEQLHAQLQEERQLCTSLRNTITVTRRIIRAKIEKALESNLRGPWRKLQDEFSVLLEALPKRNTASNKLMDTLDWFKVFKQRVEDAFENAFDWPESSDEKANTKHDAKSNMKQGSQQVSEIEESISSINSMTPTSLDNETHILTTNEPNLVNSNSSEKEHVAQMEYKNLTKVNELNIEETEITWETNSKGRNSQVDIPMLMLACPQFADMARTLENGFIHDWNELHRAAAKIRAMAGISEDAWNLANKVLGPAYAAATIALIFDKHSNGEIASPGGYLRGMVNKAQAGDLHLDRSFYGRLSGVGAQ